jgi:hypothetical protein
VILRGLISLIAFRSANVAGRIMLQAPV